MSLGKQFNVSNNLSNRQLGGFLNDYDLGEQRLDEIQEETDNHNDVEDMFT